MKNEYKNIINIIFNHYDSHWILEDLLNMTELNDLNIIFDFIDKDYKPLFYSTEFKNKLPLTNHTHQIFFDSNEVAEEYTMYARDYTISGVKFNVLHQEKVIQVIGSNMDNLVLSFIRQEKINIILE